MKINYYMSALSLLSEEECFSLHLLSHLCATCYVDVVAGTEVLRRLVTKEGEEGRPDSSSLMTSQRVELSLNQPP